MSRRTRRVGSSRAGDLRVHLLVLLTLLATLVVFAGLTAPAGERPDQALPKLLLQPEVERDVEADEPAADTGGDVLYVPTIDLLAPIVDIEVDPSGVLSPPDDTDIVGWWQRSAEPGARKGQTVITGHTVHSGGGIMNELGELVAGDVIRVRDEGQVVEYRVTDKATLSTDEVAENAQFLFGQHHQEGRLVLVTCTDWVDGDYLSNIIVVADPVRA